MSNSLIDVRITAKPSSGPNAGVPFEFSAQTKYDFDPGTKRTLAKGRREAPIYTITGAAEPKLTLELSSAHEYTRWWAHLHGGQPPVRGRKCTISAVLTREGVPTTAWRWLRVSSPAPGFSASDSGVTGKADFTVEDAHLNGITIYEDKA